MRRESEVANNSPFPYADDVRPEDSVWRQLLFPMATIKTAVHYAAAGSVAARVFDFAPAALAR